MFSHTLHSSEHLYDEACRMQRLIAGGGVRHEECFSSSQILSVFSLLGFYYSYL